MIEKHATEEITWIKKCEGLKEEIERLTVEYTKEKEEIDKSNKEAISKIKQEIEVICVDKTE